MSEAMYRNFKCDLPPVLDVIVIDSCRTTGHPAQQAVLGKAAAGCRSPRWAKPSTRSYVGHNVE